MNENIFFDIKKIKKLGKNTIIGKTVRLRHPELCTIENNSIIDDFTYVSTKLNIGSFSHIASHVTISGGQDGSCKLGDFSGIGSGTRIFCDTSDFEDEIASIIPRKFKKISTAGDVIMEKFTATGGNVVVLPKVVIPEGTVIGACSLVPSNMELKAWTIYAGIPIKPLKKRNKEKILKQAQQCLDI